MSLEGLFPTHVKQRVTEVLPILGSGVPTFLVTGDTVTIAGIITFFGDSNGIRNRLTTSPINGAIAGIQGDFMYTRAMNAAMYFKFKLLQTTCRVFIGLTDQTTSGMVGSTNPIGNFAGLYFDETSTNFRFIRCNGVTRSEQTISGADFNLHDCYLFTKKSGGGDKVLFQHDVVNRLEGTTNLPTNATLLRYMAVLRTNSAVARSFELGKVAISQES